MIHHLELAGRRLALACETAPTLRDERTAVVTAPHLAVLHDMPGADVYRTGQNSWSPAGWRPLAGPPLRIEGAERRRTADDDPWDDPVRHHSSWVTVLEAGETALLVGALEGPTPRLRADAAALEAFTGTGERATWLIRVGTGPGAGVRLLSEYASDLGERLGRRPIVPQRVWCSWYSYYEGVSQAALDAELPVVAGLGVDTLQVDDGWQRCVGDWEAGPRFEHGMRHCADRIRAAGLRPGLWLAPFIALPGSRTVREHPEFLITDDGAPARAGSNWGGPYYALDVTRADVQDHLARVIRRVVHDWGFGYLKLDFLNAAAIPGRRREEVDREEAYRRGIALIRRIAGEKVFLLGSGAPLIPSLGILDAVRVGPDVAPMWDNYATSDPSDATALNALRNGVNRLWLGGAIGIDPDVVFFRHRRNLLSDEQMGHLRDLGAACRFRCLSDRADWTDEAERAAVRTYMAGCERVALVDRYSFRLDDREVDLSDAVVSGDSPYPL